MRLLKRLIRRRRRTPDVGAIKAEWKNTSELRAATLALKGRAEG